MKRRNLALLALTPLALLAAGCASTANDDSSASAAAVRSSGSLAAGDNAGHALFGRPVAIGPMNSPNGTIYATVPTR